MIIINWLFSMPFPAMAAVVIGAGLGISILGTWIIHNYFTMTELLPNNPVGGQKFGFMEAFFFVFLLYPLTMSWMDYNTVRRNLQTEASTIEFLDKTLSAVESSQRQQVHEKLRLYARSIVEDEWPTMAAGEGSPATMAALQQLCLIYADLRPATEAQRLYLHLSMPHLGKLFDLRESRLTAARHPHGLLFIAAMTIAILLTIIFQWFFGLPSIAWKMVISGTLVISMMSAVLFILVLSYPFKGEFAMSPTPFMRQAW